MIETVFDTPIYKKTVFFSICIPTNYGEEKNINDEWFCDAKTAASDDNRAELVVDLTSGNTQIIDMNKNHSSYR